MLAGYTVMQHNQWNGRTFFQAQERRSGAVVYLIEEPLTGAPSPFAHPTLPPVQVLATEGDRRWLVSTPPEGDSLEDLRNHGRLTERDVITALLSTVDGIAHLAAIQPPLVPAYLDPACIKRDRLGRWTLDYLTLAHAPEARMSGGTPLGVYPFGVLLYWLITGDAARHTRVQIAHIQSRASAALQFMVIRCLGRVYPSLAELRVDLERAGNEREFRGLAPVTMPVALVEPAAPPVLPTAPRLEPPASAVPSVVIERPWALPIRQAAGYNTVRLNKGRLPVGRTVGVVALGALLVALVAIRIGVVPAMTQPALDQPSFPQVVTPTPLPYLPQEVEELSLKRRHDAAPTPVPAPGAGLSQPTAPITAPPPPKPIPPPVTKPPVVRPPLLPPEPGTTAYLDARAGGAPVLVFLEGRPIGYAYLLAPAPTPIISLYAFNELFGRKIYWSPDEGNGIRLLLGTRLLLTSDYRLVQDRLWLKLTDTLANALGIQPPTWSGNDLSVLTKH